MAKPAEATPAPAPPPTKDSSTMSFVVGMLASTFIAVAAGGLFGFEILAKVDRPTEGKSELPVAESTIDRLFEGANMKALAPIVTNLADSERTWIRLEAAIVLEGDLKAEGDVLAAKIGEDILAFLRTVSLGQIEGASGWQHLREDLIDRARVRSGGKIRDLIIQSLVLE